MSIDIAQLDQMQSSYKAAVDQWIAAIRQEEALASAKEFMQLHKDLAPGWEGVCELRAFAT